MTFQQTHQVTSSLLPTGSDYVISGNLSPDLGFGMFGVRRMGSKSQMALYTSQFDPHNPVSPVSPLRGLIKRVSGAVNSPGSLRLMKSRPVVDNGLEAKRVVGSERRTCILSGSVV